MEVRIEHALAPEDVAQRIAELARKHAVDHTPAGERAGTLAKATAFGPVEARYSIEAGALAVCVTRRPAFLPEGLLRRTLAEKLSAELAG
jgi:hypothetical protein